MKFKIMILHFWKSIPVYCKKLLCFYNKPALLGVKKLNRK